MSCFLVVVGNSVCPLSLGGTAISLYRAKIKPPLEVVVAGWKVFTGKP